MWVGIPENPPDTYSPTATPLSLHTHLFFPVKRLSERRDYKWRGQVGNGQVIYASTPSRLERPGGGDEVMTGVGYSLG